MSIVSFSKEYRFLSNFWASPLEYEGIKYATVEHAYQASKSSDNADRVMVSKLPTAGQAKKVGRQLVIRADWEEVKDDVMLDLLREKFSLPNLRDLILSTGEEFLEEGNTWGDVYWGVCGGSGQNKLGKLLMLVRDELRE